MEQRSYFPPLQILLYANQMKHTGQTIKHIRLQDNNIPMNHHHNYIICQMSTVRHVIQVLNTAPPFSQTQQRHTYLS